MLKKFAPIAASLRSAFDVKCVAVARNKAFFASSSRPFDFQ